MNLFAVTPQSVFNPDSLGNEIDQVACVQDETEIPLFRLYFKYNQKFSYWNRDNNYWKHYYLRSYSVFYVNQTVNPISSAGCDHNHLGHDFSRAKRVLLKHVRTS